MNYYKHHIGDYAKKTGHLTPLEHGVYLLMLHAYYGSEKPLPIDSIYRIAHAHSKAERAAVDSIATQFWKKTDAGLINGRAFEELEHAVGLVEIAKENGKKGGRPKRTQRVIKNNPAGSEIETQRVIKNKAIQRAHDSDARLIPDSDSEDQGSSAASRPTDPSGGDPRKAIFDLGKRILGASAGGLISAAITRKGESYVAGVIGEMSMKTLADPKAYFQAATRVGHDRVVV